MQNGAKAQHRFAPFRILHSSFRILQDPKPLHILLNRPNPANAEIFNQGFGLLPLRLIADVSDGLDDGLIGDVAFDGSCACG